jgi:phage recombination protein Bet
MTALAVREELPLAERLEQERELIRSQIAPGCPDQELSYFIKQCVRLGLDPVMRQAYFIKRWSQGGDKWTFQVSIDGFRAVADRTGVYAGSDDASFEYHDETLSQPHAAHVTVWKMVQGVRCPFSASARWAEYFPGEKQGRMWQKMPHVMLAKVAEALALRKAFPAQLSGVYAPEEMDQASRDAPLTQADSKPDPQPKIRTAWARTAPEEHIDSPSAENLGQVIDTKTGEILPPLDLTPPEDPEDPKRQYTDDQLAAIAEATDGAALKAIHEQVTAAASDGLITPAHLAELVGALARRKQALADARKALAEAF